MSYSDKGMGRERLTAAGLVVLVEGAVLAALISGLAMTVTPKLDPPFTAYPVPETTAPPPDDVRPLTKVETPAAASVAPERPLVAAPIALDPVFIDALPPVELTPAMPVEPATPEPTPTAADLSRAAVARGRVGDWFPQDSYPPAAIRAQAEGRVGVAVTVLATGRIAGCEVVSSSGNADLDAATCRLAVRNGRFQPARNAAGDAVTARIVLPSVRWQLTGR